EEFSTQLSTISDERARIQVDHEDKKTVLKSIVQMPRARGSALLQQLTSLEKEMTEVENIIKKRHRTLVDLSGSFSALSYSRESIKPNDKVYPKAEKIISDYE